MSVILQGLNNDEYVLTDGCKVTIRPDGGVDVTNDFGPAYSDWSFNGHPMMQYSSNTIISGNQYEKQSKEEVKMNITHVDIEGFPVRAKVTAVSVMDAINKAHDALKQFTGFTGFGLTASPDVEITDTSATLSVKINRFTDANGNVHVLGEDGKFVPVK